MTERLLLLSPFFHPEPISTGRYNTFLAKALVEKGIRVDMICFHPLYPDWRPRFSSESLSDVGIYRGGEWIRFPKRSLLRRAVLESTFFVHVLRHAGRIKRYSKIVAVLPPMLFLPLVWVCAGSNARVTAIVHDLQGIMAGVGLRRGSYAVLSIIRCLEAMVLRCCHRLIALSSGMATFLSESYKIPCSKIAVCRPFVSLDNRGGGNRLGHLFDGDKKHVVYAGALGEKQNPDNLVSFLSNLVDRRSDIVCHIFSGGLVFESLRKDRKWKNSRLIFHDLILEQDLNELYLRSSIQIIPEKPGFSAGAVPSKLPNLLAAGVPILYIGEKNSDVWRLIQDCNAGQCSDSWKFAELSDLVDKLLIECDNRSHTDRRISFTNKYARLFSVEALIQVLLD